MSIVWQTSIELMVNHAIGARTAAKAGDNSEDEWLGSETELMN
jgi:hypothetical protein